MKRDVSRYSHHSLEMGSKTSLTRKLDRNLVVTPQYIHLGIVFYLFIYLCTICLTSFS